MLDSEAVIGQLPLQSAAIDSEIELLRSPALMKELAAALGLEAQRTGDETLATEDIAGSLAGAIEVAAAA